MTILKNWIYINHFFDRLLIGFLAEFISTYLRNRLLPEDRDRAEICPKEMA
jgi:hypothetical protein